MATTIEKPQLRGETKAAVVDLLYRLADDALFIGHRNSEWTGIGPILEEDIAFSSMAQDKMGHATVLYGMLHELGEAEPNALAFGRKAEQYRCSSLVVLECLAEGGAAAELSNNPVRDELLSRGDWAVSLVRQFLFSEADALRWAALEGSAYEPLAQFAKKLRGEIKYHTMHGRIMMEKLGRAAESKGRLQTSLDSLYPHALGLFEPTKHDAALTEAGICPREAELCKAWEAQVVAILERCGLKAPRNAKPVYGGRQGKHPPEMREVLDALQKVYRLDPAAQW
ncbi:MAG TPA: 1,2-phenylacetyl-CoA epoxidase subunit PaaC [Phycisphaerae bacterium]|nr:1,2-phenylacetyl-CoA epoxidase subunit PaaC [Phycisphaerae bacterium]